MLIKHKNGQVIDYSLIVRMPPFRSVKAFKSSEFKTEYSGNMPAELVIEVAENKYVRTTNFVAEHETRLSEFEIFDRDVHTLLVGMLYDGTLKAHNLPFEMDRVDYVSLAFHDIKKSCVIGFHYTSDHTRDGENGEWIFCQDIRAHIKPCSDCFKTSVLSLKGYGAIKITNATLVDGGDILVESADNFRKIQETSDYKITEVHLTETEYGWGLVAWLDVPEDNWFIENAIVAEIENQDDICMLQGLLLNGAKFN